MVLAPYMKYGDEIIEYVWKDILSVKDAPLGGLYVELNLCTLLNGS